MATLDDVVIHLGMPKTGSTAIQDALAANRHLLATNGYWYPETAARGSAHHPLAWAATLARKPRTDVPRLDSLLDKLEEELAGRSGMGIISSESLFHVPRAEIAPVIEWFRSRSHRLSLVVYVRPPAALHEGWYRQLVKMSGYAVSFSEHLDVAPVVDTYAHLSKFESLTPDHLTVRPYLRSWFPIGSVVSDFAATIGLDRELLREQISTMPNASLDAELTEFKLTLNQGGVTHTPRLERSLGTWTVQRSGSDRSLFSEDTWQKFVRHHGPRHQQVVESFSLPDELRDHRPTTLTETVMSGHRFEELLQEFESQDPSTAAEVIQQLDR